MKHFIFLLIILTLCGCGTIGSVRRAVFGDPSIGGKDKVEYAKVVEEKEAEFRKYRETNRSFMPFHYAAIILIVGGFVLAALGQTTKDEGAWAVLCGFSLSAWALLAPKYIAVVGVVFGGFVILLAVFLIRWILKPTK